MTPGHEVDSLCPCCLADEACVQGWLGRGAEGELLYGCCGGVLASALSIVDAAALACGLHVQEGWNGDPIATPFTRINLSFAQERASPTC